MSISETRRVILDEDELRAAVTNCPSVANALGLSGAAVGRVTFMPADGCVMFNTDSEPVRIAAEGLVALMVADCLRLGVPLPRNGAKNLKVLANGVELAIDLKTEGGKRSDNSAPKPNDRFSRAMVWPTSREVLKV